MSMTDKFRLGRYFRNVESMSWDLHFLSMHSKIFFVTILTASVLGSDIFIDSVHNETSYTDLFLLASFYLLFSQLPHSKSEVISPGTCMTYQNLTEPRLEKCL